MIRILFVDDERAVLEGLRMSLRRKRNEWSMKFVDSGAAALAEVKAEPPDVIVTDMRMPSMDGAELLARVTTIAPRVTRLVLSGQMDEDVAARAVNVAHRFIGKPCDGATLEAAISRALALQSFLSSDVMSDKLGGLETLPSLPRVYTALGDAMRDPNVSLGTVSSIMREDVAMTAKLLQLVNSAFFGLPKNIVNVHQAVSYLGLQTIQNLVLVHSVFQQLPDVDPSTIESQQAHALLSASIARKLVGGAREQDTAETAAMLHDTGMLALESRLPGTYVELREEARRRGLPLNAVEREHLKVTHAEVGAYLLGLWGLPQEILEAVAGHHRPWSEVTEPGVAAAVRIADALAAELVFTQTERIENGAMVPEDVLDRLGLRATVEAIRRDWMGTSKTDRDVA